MEPVRRDRRRARLAVRWLAQLTFVIFMELGGWISRPIAPSHLPEYGIDVRAFPSLATGEQGVHAAWQ